MHPPPKSKKQIMVCFPIPCETPFSVTHTHPLYKLLYEAAFSSLSSFFPSPKSIPGAWRDRIPRKWAFFHYTLCASFLCVSLCFCFPTKQKQRTWVPPPMVLLSTAVSWQEEEDDAIGSVADGSTTLRIPFTTPPPVPS